MRTVLAWLLIPILAAAVTLGAIYYLAAHPRPSRHARTVAYIRAVLMAQDLCLTTNLNAQLKQCVSSEDINRLLSKVCAQCFVDYNLGGQPPSKDGFILDGWGRPLRMALNGTDAYKRLCGQVQGPRFVSCWSCGPNGIDEHGCGDDVFSYY
jgi:hypothetical protein